jgi:mono/diheme cytochrome c family protein
MLPTRYRPCSPFLAPGRVLAAAVICLKAAAGAADTPVDFNRDIRPILSDNCFACHGPDENTRKAGFRLDLKEEAFQALDDGRHAIVPGDAANSELARRITTDDPDDRMPPTQSTKQLSVEQIGLLRRWIEEDLPKRVLH